MNDLQRDLVRRMRDEVARHRAGELPVEELSSKLRGLFDAADLQERGDRDDFEALWAQVDAEAELRTEAWAPPGLAYDANLAAAVQRLEQWTLDMENRA